MDETLPRISFFLPLTLLESSLNVQWKCSMAAGPETLRRRNQARNKDFGRDPFNQIPDRFDREKWSTSKGGPVFLKLFQLDRTDP